MTQSQILRLFGNGGLRDLFTTHIGHASGNPPIEEEDEADDGYGGLGNRRARRSNKDSARYPPIPSEKGRELMGSGTFGENEYYEDKLRKRKDRLASRLMYRELGIHADSPKRVNKLVSQVRFQSWSHSLKILMHVIVGSHTFFERRHYRPLQCSMLFRSILG